MEEYAFLSLFATRGPLTLDELCRGRRVNHLRWTESDPSARSRLVRWKKVHLSQAQEPRADSGPSRSLSALGVYQPNVMTNQIDEQPVACHLFENTVQMSIAPNLTFSGLEKGIMPCQIMCAHTLPQSCALH